MSIVTLVRRSNLSQQTSTNEYRTTISTLQITRTIFVYIRFHVNQHTFTSLIPFTKSNPFLIVSPQIRFLTSFRMLQSNSHYCRIRRTCNIVVDTNSSKVVTHLKVSTIVQDITFFTVLFNSRSKTINLATSFQILCRNIRSRITISNEASIYPKITILIRCTSNTQLIFLIVQFQYSSRTEPIFFQPQIDRSITQTCSSSISDSSTIPFSISNGNSSICINHYIPLPARLINSHYIAKTTSQHVEGSIVTIIFSSKYIG